MKALPYSVKAYIQAPNAKGLARIGLHYYNGKLSAVGIGESVPATLWDKKQGLVSTRFVQHEQVNALIRLRCQQMGQAASATNAADWKTVRALYEALIQESERQTLKADRHAMLDIVEDYVNADEAVAVKQTAEKQIAESTATLKRLAKKGIVIETEETKAFDAMLKTYPAKFINKGTGLRVRQQIDSFIERLRTFSRIEGFPLTFAGMDSDFYTSFGTWVMTKRAKPAYNNYFGANIKRLKTFLRWCESNGQTVNPQYRDFKVLTEEKEIVYLNDSEIQLLNQFTSHPACNPTWIKYIHFTLFQCLTGLRYSDVAAAKWKVEAGFLKGTAKKNKGNYKVPLGIDGLVDLSGKLTELLKAYPDGFKSSTGKKLFAEQNYNDNIKEITGKLFEVHGINLEFKIKFYKYQFEKEIEFKKYKHELLSSHSNRRSFCTRAIQAGFTEKEVLTMIGSKSMVELRRYIRVEEDSLLAKVQRLAS